MQLLFYILLLYIIIIYYYFYERFGKNVEFKKYLHGVCDAGSRLLFKFRSLRMVYMKSWVGIAA